MVLKRNLDLSRVIEISASDVTNYHFKNELADCASSITIEDEHIFNLFIGQLLLAPSDRPFFEKLAEEFGFPLGKYMEALTDVMLIEKMKMPDIHDFLGQFDQQVNFMEIDKNV